MGLLDEAIREHLELKRRSGADPTTVERAEREALAPALPDADASVDGEEPDLVYDPAGETPLAGAEIAPHSDGDARLAELQTVGQDTAELDMQAVLEEDGEEAEGSPPIATAGEAPVRPSLPSEVHGAVSPAREVSSERVDASAREDVPGQERLAFE
jgi:hypothetical protein